MSNPYWTDALRTLDACPEAIAYCQSFDSFDAAWQACERSDWMLWYAGRVSGTPESASRRRLVGAAAECAALRLPQWTAQYPDDPRVADCLALCVRYAAGDATVTLHALRASYATAYAAATAAAAAYATATAAAAAYAVAAAAAAAAYAYPVTAGSSAPECAAIVRRWYPVPSTPEVRDD